MKSVTLISNFRICILDFVQLAIDNESAICEVYIYTNKYSMRRNKVQIDAAMQLNAWYVYDRLFRWLAQKMQSIAHIFLVCTNLDLNSSFE